MGLAREAFSWFEQIPADNLERQGAFDLFREWIDSHDAEGLAMGSPPRRAG